MYVESERGSEREGERTFFGTLKSGLASRLYKAAKSKRTFC